MRTLIPAKAPYVAAALLGAAFSTPVWAAMPSQSAISLVGSSDGATFQKAFIDGPAQGHRRTKKSKDSSSTVQPRAAEPQAETADAHKAYLKRYGF